VTLLDAAYALDEIAAGRMPHRARLFAGVRALDKVRVEETAAVRELLDAAAELHLVADGDMVDLTQNGRARSKVLAAAARRLSSRG
jgi:hypothetical protein